MHNSIKKVSLILMVGVLSSCGYNLKEVYDGDAYNSPLFGENYYRVYDSDIDPNNPNNKINETADIELNSDADLVGLKYTDAWGLDTAIPNTNRGETEYDQGKLHYFGYEYPKDDPSLIGVGYGPTRRMSRIDSIFSYGYVSKLFDGQMFCGGLYERARVQIDNTGFGRLFEKEVTDQTGAYFALNLKGAANSISGTTDIQAHMSKVNLHVSFFLRNGSGYKKVTASYVINEMPTRYNEMPDNYVFFTFALNPERIDIKRCAGFSIAYDLLDDGIYTGNPDIQHALLLYEMTMPFTSWR